MRISSLLAEVVSDRSAYLCNNFSNILCKTNIEWDDAQVVIPDHPFVDCVLGDFSSAWNGFSHGTLYTGGPSRLEQTDEYAPPEALHGSQYRSPWLLGPAFDSWSIGIVALELLLGTPNVFTVDQRTRAVITHKMRKQGASNQGALPFSSFVENIVCFAYFSCFAAQQRLRKRFICKLQQHADQ